MNAPAVLKYVKGQDLPQVITTWPQQEVSRVRRLIHKKRFSGISAAIEWTECLETKQTNPKCWRFNRYVPENYCLCRPGFCSGKTHEFTTLHNLVFHCNKGTSCPEYYSRSTVFRQGFRVKPAYPRFLYNSLFPPHPKDCTCKADNKMPEDISHDTNCYCDVVLGNLLGFDMTYDISNCEPIECQRILSIPEWDNFLSFDIVPLPISDSPATMFLKSPQLHFQLGSQDKGWSAQETRRDRVERVYDIIEQDKIMHFKNDSGFKQKYGKALEA